MNHLLGVDRRMQVRNPADGVDRVQPAMLRRLDERARTRPVVHARITRQERIAPAGAAALRHRRAQAIDLPLGGVQAHPLLDRVADDMTPIFNSHP